MPRTSINVNGTPRAVDAPSDTPLLYVLRNDLQLSGPQFGCGMAQCGACAVLLDGKATRSCVTPLSQVGAKKITTLEGLPQRWAQQQKRPTTGGEAPLHPIQQAWIDEQVSMCGFCQNGMIIKAVELLERTPSPTVAQITAAYTTDGPSPHLCRCGTYVAIREAVQRASTAMAKGGRNA
jgi:aerobic-type carbon monoxide dehydrogenase small subunit (CoxS/CutS family)